MAKYIHTFILILLLLHVLEFALANKFSSLSHADECSLLFQFKQSMSISNSASIDSGAYPKVDSWNLNRSRNCCLWDGVECRFGHVIRLDLSSSFLSGRIYSNSSLFRLIHLRTLNLADNHFHRSQIPSGIGRLSQLAFLNLSGSFLAGSGFSGDVPKQISRLRNLVSLDLSRNNELYLQSSDFQNLVRNSSETLRELLLSYVSIDYEIPASIGNLTHLNILKLSGCGFTGTLPASVSNLTQLRELHLDVNGMIGQIPSSLTNLTHLTALDLSYNEFTGSLPSFESFSNLTYLDLSRNSFDRWKLPNWFGKLNKITYLDLGDVNLYGEIPSSFFNLTQVQTLGLSRNQLDGKLPSSVLNFQNLGEFYMYDNNFTVDFYLFLSLKNLKYLYLSGNNITLSVMYSHTNETQPEFKRLGLASCNLKVFPEFLRFQHQLEYLNLDNNSIEGQIPGWMWNISTKTLSELTLSYNLLAGFEQHSPIVASVSLQLLDLSHNMLTGEIPQSICDLSLLLLDLSFNNLTSSIPPCLEKLSNSLFLLDLRSNSLQGTIPNIFTNESNLQIIDLSENKLEGHVPKSLKNCEALEILNLGYNLIEDVFPFWLGALLELQVLILRFNKFHGIITIPMKIKVNFPKLHIIDLSYNSFYGDLPYQYFQEWSAMKDTTKMNEIMLLEKWFSIQITNKGVKMDYEKIINIFCAIDLSSNMFSGKIPESIKTLSGLQLLNLSNNQLSGVIPPAMGNLMRLESLDLSSNKLSGMIPQELVRLNFLEFFNVSNNSLTGPIPKGRQFDTFSNSSYIGNQELCGYPLSLKCGDPKGSEALIVSLKEDTESDFPNEIGWAVILIGAVSGLVIGLVFGNHLTTRYYKWFLLKI